MRLTLEKPVYGGDCLGRLPNADGTPGKTVFVPLTLPGETVEARVVEEKRTYLKAELDRVVAPSPQRVEARCAHFGVCGGCQYQHAGYPAQLEMKRQILRETLSRAGVAVPGEIAVLAGDRDEPWGYRNRIRLALTPDGEAAYRSRNSHDLVPIRECPIAAPVLVEIALDLGAVLDSMADAQFPRNDVSEVELFTDRDGSEVLVAFHTRSGNSIPRKLHFPPRDDSPRACAERDDPPFLTYRAANFDFRVDHGAFFQVNRWLVDDFVELVTGGLSGQLAWDLYAGVGLFARPLADRFAQVHAVESAPASTAALRQNLSGSSGIAFAASTLDYLRRNREQREARPDLIVLDPPRAGLGGEITTLLNAIGAPRMVYVSCDPATLARDLAGLTQERYRIDEIALVDMFPQTGHLETVVRLSRS